MRSSIGKIILRCFILLASTTVYAQKETRILQAAKINNTARALIIGISKYAKLPLHNQLDYADDDALAFEKFLISRPDLVSQKNIITLINEDASDKNLISNTLYNLLNESSKGDLLIVYFSGHGDIQNVLGKDKGFLLLHNVSNDGDYYTSDALRISEIQELLTTAASKKEVKILLITDACHSGKILTSANAQDKVLSSLTTEWGNIYKLVSCQPTESSFESKRWGKGHGVFSYYLIYALKGLADKSNDNQLKFGEIASYIYNNVTEETNWKQNPDAKGPKGNVLLGVIEDQKNKALAEFKSDTSKSEQLTTKSLGNYFGEIPTDLSFIMGNFQHTLLKGIIIPSDTTIYASLPKHKKINVVNKKYATVYNKNARAVCISNKGELIAVGGKDDKIKIIDSKTQEQLINFDCKGVLSLQFTKDDRYLISGDWFNKTTIWDIENKKKVKEIRNDNDIRTIALNTTGNLLATAGNGNYITIYNTTNWEEIAKLKKHHYGIVKSLAFYNNDKQVISGAEDNKLIVRSIEDNNIILQKNLGADVNDIEITTDNKYIFVGTSKGNVNVYNYKDLKPITKYRNTVDGIESIEITNNGDYVIVAGKQRKIVIVNNKKQKEVFQTYIPRGVSDMDFNPNNEQLAFAMYGGKLGIFDLENTKSFVAGYAQEFYEELKDAHLPEYLQKRIDGYFVSQLIAQSKGITNYFINGEGQRPTENNFTRANACLRLAKDVANNDKYYTSKIDFTSDLLNIFRTLNNNNLSKLSMAEHELRKLIGKYPDATFTYNTLSAIFRQQNLLDSAENNAFLSSERIPSWTEPKANLAKAKVAKGEYHLAIEELKKIIKLQPQSSKGYKYLADLHSYLGNYKNAESLFRKAESLNKSDAWIYQRQAILKIRNNQIAEAKQLLTKAIQINPDDYRANFIKAKLLHYEYVLSSEGRKQSKFTEISSNLYKSLSIYVNLLENHPNCLGLHTEMSELFFSIHENKAKSINLAKIELLIDSKKVLLNINIKNYLAIAKSLAQKAIQKNPFDAKAYYLLAKYHSKRKDKKKTNESINRLYASVSNEALCNFFAGKLFYESGDFKNARKKLEASLALDPYFVPAIYIYFKTFKGKPQKNKLGEKIRDILQFNTIKQNQSLNDLEKRNEILGEKVNDFKSPQYKYVEYFQDVFY